MGREFRKSSKRSAAILTGMYTRCGFREQFTYCMRSRRNRHAASRRPRRMSNWLAVGSDSRNRITRRDMAKRSNGVVASSGNVFADLGLPAAEEKKTKVQLPVARNQIIQKCLLSQPA